MEIIQRLGLFSKLFKIWQNSKQVCKDSSSVILKSKGKSEKYNLQSWFIYPQLKSSFMFVNFLNSLDFSIFPPKEQWINKLKTLKMFEGVCFTVLNVDTGKISSPKNILISCEDGFISHISYILKSGCWSYNNSNNNNNNNGFLTKTLAF